MGGLSLSLHLRIEATFVAYQPLPKTINMLAKAGLALGTDPVIMGERQNRPRHNCRSLGAYAKAAGILSTP